MAKKRAEREARIRAAKKRQRQRLVLVLTILVVGGVLAAYAVLSSGDEGTFAGGDNCGGATPQGVSESTSPTGDAPAYTEPPAMQIDCDKDYVATIVTNHGDIEVKLHDNVAPVTVNNFVALARDGFYDDLTFHRVIADFMIQGGDPQGDGTGGPGYKFQDEFDPTKNFDKPYVLAMANSGPNTNGSQFFITVAPTTHLNQKHTIFGQVISGQDVVDTISTVETGPGDVPVDPVVIQTIEIEEIETEATPTDSPSASPTASPSAVLTSSAAPTSEES